jgi:hypothetical protein
MEEVLARLPLLALLHLLGLYHPPPRSRITSYPNSKTQRFGLRSFFIGFERGGTMPIRTFKLKMTTLAIHPENDQMVTIPANALVTLVDGDTDGNGFVKVRYRDQVTIMFAEDLRSRGERVREQST